MLAIAVPTMMMIACSQETEVSMGTATGDYVSPALATFTIGKGLNGGVMALLLSLFVAAGVGLLIWQLARYGQYEVVRTRLVVASFLAFVIFLAAATVNGAYVSVDAGRVGVLVRQGKPVRTLDPGFHLITPFWDEVVTFSTRDWTFITMSNPIDQGSEEYRTYSMDIITQDGVSASVKFNVQGRLDPSQAIHVYQQYGTLENAIVQLIKSPSLGIIRTSLQGFSAIALIDDIDAVSEEVEGRLRPIVEEGGITMIFFTFRKPSLGAWEEELNNARVAEQQAVVADQRVATTEAEARQAVAEAEGNRQVTEINAEAEAAATMSQRRADADADLYSAQQAAEAVRIAADADAYAILARAEAEAAGMRQLAPSLTADLIQFTMWQNWNGQLPTWMTGATEPVVTLPGPNALSEQ